MKTEEKQKKAKSFVLVPQKELKGSVLAREHNEVNQEILKQLKEAKKLFLRSYLFFLKFFQSKYRNCGCIK